MAKADIMVVLETSTKAKAMDYIPFEGIELNHSAYVEQKSARPQHLIKPGHVLVASSWLPEPTTQPKKESTALKDPLLQKIESELSGKTFELVVKEEKINIGSNSFNIPAYRFKDSQTITAMLKKLAKTDNIRVFFPGSMGTHDYVAERVNFVFDSKGTFQRCFKG